MWDRAFLDDGGKEHPNAIVLCKTNGCSEAPTYKRHH